MSETENQLIDPAARQETEQHIEASEAVDEQSTATEAPAQEEPPAPAAPQEKQYPRKAVNARIDQLTAQRREAERQAGALRLQVIEREAELARLRQQAQAGNTTGGQPAPTEPTPSPDPHALAAQIAAEQRFNDRANEIYEAGLKAHSDFQETCDSLRAMGAMSRDLVEAIADEPDAHNIIAYLGHDIERAQAISKLSGARLGREIARIEAELKKPAPVSRAPAPVRPTTAAKVNPPVDYDKLTMEQYAALRDKEERERRLRR